jgi:hypothetical protein
MQAASVTPTIVFGLSCGSGKDRGAALFAGRVGARELIALRGAV